MNPTIPKTPNDIIPIFKASFFLTAGESNARGEMPMALIAERIIEVATRHANHLNIGYSRLAPQGVGWVLSKLGFEMSHVPHINETYSIETWIESWNRLYSERCFRFSDADGNTIGWGRSIWAIIDVNTRRAADLSAVVPEASTLVLDLESLSAINNPMPRMRNHTVTAPTRTEPVKFKFTDLDFNRHVNSARYIQKIVDAWPLSHYDRYRIDKFEIAYKHECHAGDDIEMIIDETQNADTATSGAMVELRCKSGDSQGLRGEVMVSASIRFVEDPFKI